MSDEFIELREGLGAYIAYGVKTQLLLEFLYCGLGLYSKEARD